MCTRKYVYWKIMYKEKYVQGDFKEENCVLEKCVQGNICTGKLCTMKIMYRVIFNRKVVYWKNLYKVIKQ